MLRACEKISSVFHIPSSGHLCPLLNRKILKIVLLFLWFYSIGETKSDPNLGAQTPNLFFRKPLRPRKYPQNISNISVVFPTVALAIELRERDRSWQVNLYQVPKTNSEIMIEGSRKNNYRFLETGPSTLTASFGSQIPRTQRSRFISIPKNRLFFARVIKSNVLKMIW